MTKTSSPQSGAKKVLVVSKVSVLSGRVQEGPDLAATRFLQEVGFRKLRCIVQRAEAEGAETEFILEYDTSVPANKKPFRLFSVKGDEWRIIDEGVTAYTPTDNERVDLVGTTMKDWETICKEAPLKVVEIHKGKVLRNQILPPKHVNFSDIPSNTYKPAPRNTRPVQPPPQQAAPPPKPAPPQPKPLVRVNLPPETDGLVKKADVIKAAEQATPAAHNRINTPTAPPSVNGVSKSFDIQVGEEILRIPPDKIDPMPRTDDAPEIPGQPRTEFFDETIHDLAANIKEVGQLMPGLVRKVPGTDRYTLIAGERRWRAVTHAKVSHYLAREVKTDLAIDRHLLAIIENNNREEQNPLDTSNAFAVQIKAGRSQADLVRLTGVKAHQLQKYLAIQSLHPELKPFLTNSTPDKDRIRLLVGEVLARIHPDHQLRIWNEAKTQPSQALILSKIRQLGKDLIQYKRDRTDRWLDSSVVALRVNARFNRMKLALTELQGLTDEELKKFAIYNATSKNPTSLTVLDEIVAAAQKVKANLSELQKDPEALRALAAPARNGNGKFVHK